MMRYGCLGVIGVMVLVAIVGVASIGARQQPRQRSNQPVLTGGAPTPDAPTDATAVIPELPTVGQAASLGNWEVTLEDYGPFERFAKPGISTRAYGKLVVVDVLVKNLQSTDLRFTTKDFAIRMTNGRRFSPTEDTATIDRGIVNYQTVQPGLPSENRVVFDVDPVATVLVLSAFGLQFKLPE